MALLQHDPSARVVAFAKPVPVASPDAAIFQAWADFKARRATYHATPEALLKAGDLEDHLVDQINEAEQRVLDLPATTLEGLAIKLRLQFTFEDITAAQFEAVLNGWLPTKDSLAHPSAQSALGVLLDVERMIKRPAVVHARPAMTDPVICQAWADFVAASRAYAAAPRENDEDEAREHAALEAAVQAFLEVPITSLEGIALRMRWQLQDGLGSIPISEALLSGAPISFELYDANGVDCPFPAVDMLVAVEDMITQPATDTAIQRAWTDYRAAQAVHNSRGDRPDREETRSYEALCEVEGKFLDIPVTDFAGAALRLRWLLAETADPEADAIIASGVPLHPDLFADLFERTMVKLILDVERLAATVPA